MEPIFYVIAIMGCADGSAHCAEARVEQARFTSMRACQAAMAPALMRSTDLSYPVITATCRASGTRMVERKSDDRRG